MANQADPGTVESAARDSAAAGSEPAAGQQAGAVAGQASAEGEVAANAPLPSQLGPYEPFHGRRVSWIAVAIVMVGFVAGSLALIFGPTGWLFWTGVGVAVLGLLIAVATNTFEDWY